ncbi:sugar phosphate isomerase/epimerase family protein [Schlesneria paludicola]|uniref:sugar phosphate isomerase/epimerase family protein n=1 Tax=Schlesneria paludicola TaxID=360056 RepID=UPI00029A7658|nr:TIM barrel protein [Schlesneria paludicola]
MHQFRLAVATRCFEQSLVESIKSATDLRVQGIQFDVRNEVHSGHLSDTGRRDLLHHISEHQLKVASTVYPLKHALYEPDRLDLRVEAIRKAMKFSYTLKVGTLCIRVGRIPEEADSKERQVLVDILCDLARYGNHVGTVLAITPTNDSAETLRTLLNDVKTGPLGIDFDPAHFAMSGRPVIDSLRSLHELVVHVQIRDGIHGIDGGQEVAVGQGNVDWIEVLALLGEMDYRGWLTAIRGVAEDRAFDLARGIKLIQRILLGG